MAGRKKRGAGKRAAPLFLLILAILIVSRRAIRENGFTGPAKGAEVHSWRELADEELLS